MFGYAVAKADDIVSHYYITLYTICDVWLGIIIQDDSQIRSDLLNALDSYYNDSNTGYDEELNDAVNFIQENLKCCGINGAADWINSTYYDESRRLPSSCCENESDNCQPEQAYNKVSMFAYVFLLHVLVTGFLRIRLLLVSNFSTLRQ